MAERSNTELATLLGSMVEAGEAGRDCSALADAVLAEAADRMRAFALSVEEMTRVHDERISHLRGELRDLSDGVNEIRAFVASIELVRAEAFRRGGGAV